MDALFDLIVAHTPAPKVEPDQPFRMLATTLEADPFLGRLLTGRVESGSISANQQVKALAADGRTIETSRVTKLLAFRGLERQPIERAEAGDIAVAGLQRATVADTIGTTEMTEALPARPIDPSTLAMTFSINDSPLAGQDGDKVTSRQIRDRLMREKEGNVAIRVRESDEKDAFEVAGRGELQLAVLIEQMRREGYELSVSRPRVLFRDNPETGKREEPIEEVTVDVDEEYAGAVVSSISERKGELQEMRASGAGKQRLVFLAPSRGLIGYHGQFLTETRGAGVMNRIFHSYAPHKGPISARRTGVLVSMESGKAVPYALYNLEDRGYLFIQPGAPVYQGMIIGENAKSGDLEVNPLKSKQLTNFRAAGKDDAVTLTTPVDMTLEKALAYIDDDELVEVTPGAIRLRKRYLDPHERKRAARRAAAE